MMDRLYNICNRLISICESTKDRIKNTPQKKWLKGYHQWKSRINKNDTDNTGNTNT